MLSYQASKKTEHSESEGRIITHIKIPLRNCGNNGNASWSPSTMQKCRSQALSPNGVADGDESTTHNLAVLGVTKKDFIATKLLCQRSGSDIRICTPPSNISSRGFTARTKCQITWQTHTPCRY